MKKWYIALCAFFAVPLLVLFGWSLADRDRAVSPSENRDLAAFPAFSLSRLFSGEFTRDFETYFSDQFPMRERFLDGAKYVNSLYKITFGRDVTLDVPVDDKWEHGGSIDPDKDHDALMTTSGTAHAVATTSDGSSASGGPSVLTRDTSSESASDTQPTTPDGTASSESVSGSASQDTRPSSSDATDPTEQTPATSRTEIPDPWGTEQTQDGDITSLESGILIIGDRAMERVYKVDSYLDHYAETVNLVNRAMPGVRVYAVLVPKSVEFNAPMAYHSGPASQLAAINYAYARMDPDVVCVDAYTNLFEHRDEPVYFRTDHHWTQRGAYWAFRAFCGAAGLSAPALESYPAETVTGFLGTMYAYTRNYAQSAALKDHPDDVEIFRPLGAATMTVYPDFSLADGSERNIIYSYDYAQDSLDASAKYMVFLGGDRPICRIVNPGAANGRKLLILKESYGNAFTPFLSDVFEEVWAVDPREFNGSGEPAFDGLAAFAAEQGITDVIVLNNVQSAIPNYMSNIRALIGAE